jgi:CspA family cold shock protein
MPRLPHTPNNTGNTDSPAGHAPRDYANGRQRRAVVDDAQATGPAIPGYIKSLTRDKGFGFIKDAAGAEYFFHRSATQGLFDTFEEGDRVTFVPMRSSKGPRAHDVVLVD